MGLGRNDDPRAGQVTPHRSGRGSDISSEHRWPAPSEDERVEFERLWSLIERSAESGLLATHIENEIRTLNRLLEITRNELDPDRYADLFDVVSSKLVELLPDVLIWLLPSEEATPAAITASIDGADPDDQLDALEHDLDAAANRLEEVEAKITDVPDREAPEVIEPVPYGETTIDNINKRFARIDATHAKLRTTRTGRFVLQNAGTAVGTVATGIGLAATDVVSGGAASLIAMVGSWLYTRIRRRLPDLPARNNPLDTKDTGANTS